MFISFSIYKHFCIFVSNKNKNNMNYYEQIDAIGESPIGNETEECKCCGTEDISYRGYCSKACYNYDTK